VCGSVTACENGAPLAEVQVTYVDRGETVVETSGADGRYCFHLMPSDEGYDIRLDKAGYESAGTHIGPQKHGITAVDKVGNVCMRIAAPIGVDGGVPDADAGNPEGG